MAWITRFVVLAAGMLIPCSLVMAETLGRPASQAPVTVSSPVGSLLQLTFGLMFVVALIFVLAWIMRRYMRLQYATSGSLRVIGGLPMGVRERLVLVQVGEKQLLLGVTPTTISTLHVLEQPVSVETPMPLEGPFADRLAQVLKRLKAEKAN